MWWCLRVNKWKRNRTEFSENIIISHEINRAILKRSNKPQAGWMLLSGRSLLMAVLKHINLLQKINAICFFISRKVSENEQCKQMVQMKNQKLSHGTENR